MPVFMRGNRVMIFQKIIIFGSGAVGSSLGALLSVNHSVTLIGRQSHIQRISSEGLRLITDSETIYRMDAREYIDHIPDNSLIIITTKAYSLPGVIDQICKLKPRNCFAVVLQNGLGIDYGSLFKKCSGLNIVRGVTYLAAEFFKPGIVRYWPGRTLIENSPISDSVVQMLNRSNIQAVVSDDIMKELWQKMMVNCIVNPLTAILKIRNDELSSDHLSELKHKLFEECSAVASSEGFIFDSQFEKKMNRLISLYKNYSSMYQDLAKGKRTEIDFLNGYIIRLGDERRIATPVNKVLYSLVKYIEGRGLERE